MASTNGTGGRREEKGRNIQVVVRCRPFNTMEHRSSYGVIDCDQSRKEVLVRTGGMNDKSSRKTYTFDMVFGPAAKQIDVYRSVVCPILDEVIMGYNCTVFAYGQTGTGKTFTMEGERTPDAQFTWEEDPLAGIIPRTLHQIFEKLSENGTEFSVKVSLLEIYNEELFDLLSPTEDVNERLQLFDDPRNKRGVVVKGLEEVVVHNKDEVYKILEQGAAKRRTASTLMNAYSSRSHSVFSVTIHMKEITLDGEELVKIGKLNLVDLAGSENIGRSGAVDKRAREAGNINQSLLTLGRVITALVEKRPHVPYRESKLTRILQDSLGGRTKTSIIATVSPSSSNLEETLSTLEYASRAKNIMNKPEVNQKLTKRTLIKEYTEEIERLKRDLAATRDKNGVYLSSENYESMMTQITAQEEQIAMMEEELKKVNDLFLDSRSRLEQCSLDLDEKRQRLEETSRHLETTKEKLVEEKFICSQLSSVHESLYSAAGQLLSAVGESTSDVSGLHAKLDRKTQVEQHNMQMQQSFSQRMDGAFSSMQRGVQQHGAAQAAVLTGYAHAVDGLLVGNEATLRGALVAMETLVGGVQALVADGAARCREKVEQHEALTREQREVLLQLLEEHQQEVQDVLAERTLPGLTAIRELGDALQVSMETQRDLADQVEAMKETGVFLSGLVLDLAALRQEARTGLSAVQEQQDRLQQQIQRAQQQHQQAMNRTVQILQDQLNLVTMETQQHYSELQAASRTLQGPVEALQQNLGSRCGAVEQRSSSQAERLLSSSSSLASSMHQAAQQNRVLLEEMSGRCSDLHGAVSGLVDRDAEWTSRTREQAARRAQDQLVLMEQLAEEAQRLHQDVATRSAEQLRAAEADLSGRQEENRRVLTALQEQTGSDRAVLEQQRAELQKQVEAGRQLVGSFLLDELQQDVSTGLTPQRREFVYPRVLKKSSSRGEMLEALRLRQEEEEEEEEDEGPDQVDQDSLEDDLSSCSESLVAEPPFVDENLVFNESKRLPFFKQKKGSRKEAKVLSRSKMADGEGLATPTKSRLPLRCQN
ncbi:kinesin-like protein KIF11 isoform X2 [Poecilia reticulata]|uniref:kinesin-like protein KIF11 isoform X2 n=1 Tax=Poecilia reticulata TaxID=8081 RepID=UPI0004A2A0B6|nr:PREDICTED: kinesin-like protein KIF11 isoform X2 [Poecilia reticulata]